MSTSARRRLLRDFKKLKNDPPAGVSGLPLDNNIMVWQAIICGYAALPSRCAPTCGLTAIVPLVSLCTGRMIRCGKAVRGGMNNQRPAVAECMW